MKPTRPLHLAKWLLLPMILVASSAPAQERFAVIVGSNAGWANDRPLRYAEADAERMRQVLVEMGGFAPDRALLLSDPDTTTLRAQLRQLASTLRSLGRPSLVLVYYSGHADERHFHLRGPPLSHQELYSLLQALPATVKLAIVDACRSGSLLAAKGGARPSAFQLQVVDELAVRGLAVLTSSGADELSLEARALAGSVFTHHLISGLRGAADLDESGWVSLAEAYHHAYQRTVVDTAASPAPHRPAFRFQVQGQGELVLTHLGRASARLVLPAGEAARYVVVDEHELRLVAEGQGLPDRPRVLALAAGRYRLKRLRAAESLEVAELALAAGQQVEAAALAYARRPLEVGLLKGEPEQMNEDERHQWKRSEALRLLAAGEVGQALGLLDELLARRPEDTASQRGRARALLRLAEVYERVGDLQRQRGSLQEALVADPSLADDPDFVGQRQWLAGPVVEQPRPAAAGLAPALWPSAGFDVVGPRGYGVVVGSLHLGEQWSVYLGIDPRGPGMDVGVRFLTREEPIPGAAWGLRPWYGFYLGLGRHQSFAELGLPANADGATFWERPYQQLYGRTVHLSGGARLGLEAGPALEAGVGFVAFSDGTSVDLVQVLSVGGSWSFR